jgi:hypothetical protein
LLLFLTKNSTNQTNVRVFGFLLVSFALFVVKVLWFFRQRCGLLDSNRKADSWKRLVVRKLVRDRLHPESNELFHECVDSLLQYGVDAWNGQGPLSNIGLSCQRRGEDAGNSGLAGSAAGKRQTWLSCPPNVSSSLDKSMSGVSMLDSSLDFPYNFSLLSGK